MIATFRLRNCSHYPPQHPGLAATYCGGVGPNGTVAAREFAINKGGLAVLWKKARTTWSGKNVEVVLATQVIRGSSEEPRIMAPEFW